MSLIVIIVYIFILVLILRGTYNLDRFSRLFLTAFCVYWAVALCLSLFSMGGLSVPKTETILILVLGVLSFIFGFKRITINSAYDIEGSYRLHDELQRFLNNKVFFGIVLLTSLYTASLYLRFIDVVVLQQISSTSEVRSMFWGDESIYGPLFKTLNDIYLSWFIHIARPLMCYALVYKRNKTFWPLLLFCFTYSGLSGGRIDYVFTILPLILVFGYFKEYNGNGSKKSKRVLLGTVGVVLFLLISWVSLLRSDSSSGGVLDAGTDVATEQIATYSAGPTVAFDYAINHDRVRMLNGYKYGRLTLWSYISPITFILYKAGQYATSKGAMEDFTYYKQIEKVDIGINWNALYTWNLYFYCDLGVVGVILFNFLFGLFIRYLIKRMYKLESICSYLLCSMYISMALLSPVDLFGYFSLMLLYVFIMFWKDRNRQKLLL